MHQGVNKSCIALWGGGGWGLMHQPYWIISKVRHIVQRRSLHLPGLNNGSSSGSSPRLRSSPGWSPAPSSDPDFHLKLRLLRLGTESLRVAATTRSCDAPRLSDRPQQRWRCRGYRRQPCTRLKLLLTAKLSFVQGNQLLINRRPSESAADLLFRLASTQELLFTDGRFSTLI